MSNNHNHIVIIIVAIMLFYLLTSSGYFAYFGSSGDDNKSSTSPKVIISFITVPIVILCIVLLVIQLTKNDSKSAKPEPYKQNEYPHGPPDYPPTPREPPAPRPPEREPMRPPSEPKIDATGLGEALKDAGWRVILADWCGFCKRQKELFNEHPEGNFDIITLTEDEAKNNDDVKDRIQGYPAWLNIKDKTKESPGYKSTIKEIAALLQM